MELNIFHLLKEDFKQDFKFRDFDEKYLLVDKPVNKINVFSYDKSLDSEIVRNRFNGALNNLQSKEFNLDILPDKFKSLYSLEKSMNNSKRIIEKLKFGNRFNVFSKDYWELGNYFRGKMGGQGFYDLIGIAGIAGIAISGNTLWLLPIMFRIMQEGVCLNGSSAQKNYFKEYNQLKEWYSKTDKKINSLEFEVKFCPEVRELVEELRDLKGKYGKSDLFNYDSINSVLMKAYSSCKD